MTIAGLLEKTGWTLLNDGVDTNCEIEGAYCGDLLSWVMAHGDEGMGWVTVQTHMNVVAVAVLADMACIILPEGITMEGESLQKAKDEDMVVLSSPLTAYEICGRMAASGIPAHN